MRLNSPFLLSANYEISPKGPSSQRFLSLMNQPFDFSDLTAISRRALQIAMLSIKSDWNDILVHPSDEDLDKFAEICFFRMFPSESNRSSDKESQNPKVKRDQWIHANNLVNSWISEGLHPNVERICELNGVFGHKIRDRSLTIRYEGFDPVDIQPALDYWELWFSEKFKTHAPIQIATLASSFIIEVHPFVNGNGRTARLVLDWILGLANIPPPSFQHKIDALIARAPIVESPKENVSVFSYDTPHSVALDRVMSGIEHTLKILAGSSSIESI
ncbi:MAG: Fic family protein [Proteobacteria bacterium]|nr:MAG: Fic family protein [Pseudomonadota bacterium]